MARRRALLTLFAMLALLLGGLGVWQARAPRASAPAAVTRLLRECLAPSVRAAGRVRNRLAADPEQPAGQPTPISQARLRALEDENARLRGLLGLRARLATDALVAEVIGRPFPGWRGHLTVDAGRAERVDARMVALSPEGVVGQVVTVDAHTASILPITDSASGIGALLERTRMPGILRGDRGGLCSLSRIPGEADIRAGDLVVTSGMGGVFPRGLTLGRVTAVGRDEALASRVATVAPAVDLARLEMLVLVRFR